MTVEEALEKHHAKYHASDPYVGGGWFAEDCIDRDDELRRVVADQIREDFLR